jgi:hypothetical protein
MAVKSIGPFLFPTLTSYNLCKSLTNKGAYCKFFPRILTVDALITITILKFVPISVYGTYVKANGSKEKPQYMGFAFPFVSSKL